VVQTTLAGEVNPDIVRLVGSHGAFAAGVTEIDGSLIVATKRDPKLGFVGEITRVNSDLIMRMLLKGVVPVIAPLALGEEDHLYNVNADAAAGALTEAFRAQKLVSLTDVDGLYADPGVKESLIQRVSVQGHRDLVGSGSVSKGMLPKLEACISAVESGVNRFRMLDGRIQDSLLLEMSTPHGIGTMIQP
jgi:acetylglutamate kinase